MKPSNREDPKQVARTAGSSRGLTLMRVFGIDVQLDWSLLVIFTLVTFNLGAGVLPSWHPDWSGVMVWSLAVGAAVLFFASLLAHELSHALVGRRLGIPVNRVTLFLFGGVAHMEKEPPSPKAEFLMAAAGPLTSGIIGIASLLAGIALTGPALWQASGEGPEQIRQALQAMGPGATVLMWLGPLNLMLGVFNLVPGFPLDGGRVLRSILWAATRDVTKATRWASGAGQLFAFTLIALGVMSLFGGNVGQGLWLMLIGWFLNNAARTSYQQLLVRQALEDVPVTRVMRTRVDAVAPEVTVDELVKEHIMVTDQHAFPVEVGESLVGLVTFEDVRKVPQARWPQTPVREVMTPAAQLTTVSPEAQAEEALEKLATKDVEQIPVVEGDHLLGVVRRQDLVKWLALHGHAARA